LIKKKNFDCVEMTRTIRDTLYFQRQGISLTEFAKKIAADARESEFYLRLTEKQKNRGKKSLFKQKEDSRY